MPELNNVRAVWIAGYSLALAKIYADEQLAAFNKQLSVTHIKCIAKQQVDEFYVSKPEHMVEEICTLAHCVVEAFDHTRFSEFEFMRDIFTREIAALNVVDKQQQMTIPLNRYIDACLNQPITLQKLTRIGSVFAAEARIQSIDISVEAMQAHMDSPYGLELFACFLRDICGIYEETAQNNIAAMMNERVGLPKNMPFLPLAASSTIKRTETPALTLPPIHEEQSKNAFSKQLPETDDDEELAEAFRKAVLEDFFFEEPLNGDGYVHHRTPTPVSEPEISNSRRLGR